MLSTCGFALAYTNQQVHKKVGWEHLPSESLCLGQPSTCRKIHHAVFYCDASPSWGSWHFFFAWINLFFLFFIFFPWKHWPRVSSSRAGITAHLGGSKTAALYRCYPGIPKVWGLSYDKFGQGLEWDKMLLLLDGSTDPDFPSFHAGAPTTGWVVKWNEMIVEPLSTNTWDWKQR